MPIWAFLKSKKKSKIHKPTGQHRRANSAGQNLAVHLHLGIRDSPLRTALFPSLPEKKNGLQENLFLFKPLNGGRDLSVVHHQQCCPPRSFHNCPHLTAHDVRTPFHDANDHPLLKENPAQYLKYLYLMFLTGKACLDFCKNSKDRRLKKLHISLWQWWLKNSNLKFSEVSSAFRQRCSKTGMQQILWFPRTFHYTSVKRPSLLKLQVFELGGVLWSF